MLRRLRRAYRWLTHEAGQTTAEYALVLLGAAGIATLLIAWARGGAISNLFDDVISKIMP
jgi:Flp pilus assembly pilin Flp